MKCISAIATLIIMTSVDAASAAPPRPFQDEATGKYGYRDSSGLVVIPPSYELAEEFEDGYAAVSLSEVGDGQVGKWGIIDLAGKVVIPPRHEVIRVVGPGYFAIRKGGARGKWGVIDSTGQVRVPVRYDNVEGLGHGFFAVSVGRNPAKRGVVDTSGKVVIPAKYGRIRALGLGRFAVAKADKRKSTAELDEDDEFGSAAETQELALFDDRGKALTPFAYIEIGAFSDGLALVHTFDEARTLNRYGFVDPTGRAVIPVELSFATSFQDGRAVVARAEGHGIIDPSGAPIVPFEYEHIGTDGDPDFIPARKGGKAGLINLKNQVIIPFEWDGIEHPTEGRIAVNRGGTWDPKNPSFVSGGSWGFIDTTGREVLPPSCDRVSFFSAGSATCVRRGRAVLEIGLDGQELRAP